MARKCFGCGEHWPHVEGKTSCPAYGKTCRKCMKLNHFQKVCHSKVPVNVLDASSCESDGIKRDVRTIDIEPIHSIKSSVNKLEESVLNYSTMRKINLSGTLVNVQICPDRT